MNRRILTEAIINEIFRRRKKHKLPSGWGDDEEDVKADKADRRKSKFRNFFGMKTDNSPETSEVDDYINNPYQRRARRHG